MAPRIGIDRARVVEVAAELADTGGLEQLTLAQVAAELGVRLPSLYNHVDGAAGLRRELAVLGLHQLYARLSRATIGKAGDAAVLALAQAYRGFVLERPGLYAATVRATPDDREIERSSQQIIEVVLAVLAPYRLSADDAVHAVRGIRSIVHGFATIELAGGFGIPLDRDESFFLLVRAYIAGLTMMNDER